MLKIVIFEDDKYLRDVYMRKFVDVGFDVKTYEYPPENLAEEIKKQKPDVILMDLNLPTIDGYEATRILKESPDTKDIPVFAITNYSTEEGYKKAMSVGMVDFMVKVTKTSGDLVEIIKSYLKDPKSYKKVSSNI